MGDKREHEIGSVNLRDWRYWIPLIGLIPVRDLAKLHNYLSPMREIFTGHGFFTSLKRGWEISRSRRKDRNA